MKLGIRAHDFGYNTPENMAVKAKEAGFKTLQLAIKKGIIGVEDIYDYLVPEVAASIEETLRIHGVDITVLGCYLNYTHPDKAVLTSHLSLFKEHLRAAKAYKAKLVGTETGSLNGDYSFTPENHSEKALGVFMNNLEELIETAEEAKAFVGIEGVYKHIVYSTSRMSQVLKQIQSDRLKVIFDPVNYMTSELAERQEALIYDAFEGFGDKIEAVHAKDFIVMNNDIEVVPPGKGLLNYSFLIKCIKETGREIPILIEDIKPDEMPASLDYIVSMY